MGENGEDYKHKRYLYDRAERRFNSLADLTATTGRWVITTSVALNGSAIIALLTLVAKVFPRTAETAGVYDALRGAMDWFFFGVMAAVMSIGAAYFVNMLLARNAKCETEAVFGKPWQQERWSVWVCNILVFLSITGGFMAYGFFLWGAWLTLAEI